MNYIDIKEAPKEQDQPAIKKKRWWNFLI